MVGTLEMSSLKAVEQRRRGHWETFSLFPHGAPEGGQGAYTLSPPPPPIRKQICSQRVFSSIFAFALLESSIRWSMSAFHGTGNGGSRILVTWPIFRQLEGAGPGRSGGSGMRGMWCGPRALAVAGSEAWLPASHSFRGILLGALSLTFPDYHPL